MSYWSRFCCYKAHSDNEVWAGNPAKKIGEINQYKDYS